MQLQAKQLSHSKKGSYPLASMGKFDFEMQLSLN